MHTKATMQQPSQRRLDAIPDGRQGTMARREEARGWLTRKANLAWQKRADIMREGPQHEI